MLVTNNGFYMIEYWDGNRTADNGSVDRWNFKPENTIANVSGPFYQPDLQIDVSQVMQEKMQCDRKLEPIQPSRK